MLGKGKLLAATNVSVYTVPATKKAVCNVSICNRSPDSITVYLAVVAGYTGVIADEDYIEYNITIPGYGVLERTGIVIDAAESIVARSVEGFGSISIWGYEETP